MYKESFITSLLTFYLKGEISCDNSFVKFKNPNTILKLIPLGTTNKSMPVPQISGVDTSFQVVFKSLVIGIIAALFGFSSMTSDSFVGGLIILIYGVLTIISSLQTNLLVHTTSGNTEIINFIIFEKNKAEAAATKINDLIIQHHDNTNVALHSAKNAEAIVNAINNTSK